MVANLCVHYGKLIGKLNEVSYYTFPCIESLTNKTVESHLRELKFGYRAKFIHDAAVYLSMQNKDAYANVYGIFNKILKPATFFSTNFKKKFVYLSVGPAR